MLNIYYYKLHYTAISFAVFFGGWLLATGNGQQWIHNSFICFLYAAAIGVSAFFIDNWLLPSSRLNKRKWLYLFYSVFIIAVASVAVPLFQNLSKPFTYLLQVKHNPVISYLLSYFLPLAFAAIITTGIAVYKKQQQAVLQIEYLQKEKVQTELNFLKAQINPHFLFNALNTVYFQIDKTNTAARNTLMQFTEMLRYQLYECNTDTVSLAGEIEFLANYINLQKLRKGNKYAVQFTADAALNGYKIAPLILIGFAENAFKYVSNNNAVSNRIDIALQKENEFIVFTCFNTTDATATAPVLDYGGIGLANTKRRLEILYSGRYSLTIGQQPDGFHVLLKIKTTVL